MRFLRPPTTAHAHRARDRPSDMTFGLTRFFKFPKPSPIAMAGRTTPGVALLTRQILALLVPVFVAIVVHQINVFIPIWLLVLATISSLPIYSAVGIFIQLILERRRAAAAGARLAPLVRGKLIGNVDILHVMMNNFKNGYPGMSALCLVFPQCKQTPL